MLKNWLIYSWVQSMSVIFPFINPGPSKHHNYAQTQKRLNWHQKEPQAGFIWRLKWFLDGSQLSIHSETESNSERKTFSIFRSTIRSYSRKNTRQISQVLVLLKLRWLQKWAPSLPIWLNSEIPHFILFSLFSWVKMTSDNESSPQGSPPGSPKENKDDATPPASPKSIFRRFLISDLLGPAFSKFFHELRKLELGCARLPIGIWHGSELMKHQTH